MYVFVPPKDYTESNDRPQRYITRPYVAGIVAREGCMFRYVVALAMLVVLSGCTAPSVANVPVEVTRVVKQEVTREVVRVQTQVVVVTATPEEAESVAFVEPTNTQEPTSEPTTQPVPTVAAEPTSAPALAVGEYVPGKILRTIRVYDIPNEHEGKEVINADPGITVHVLYRGGQWYQIEAVSTGGETVTGWVYHDWISIAPADEARLQPNPDPLPVVVSKITQTVGNDGKKYWTGTVMNVGAKRASDVQVEISLNGQVGDTATRADRGTAFVATRNLEPGQASKFTVQTDWVRGDNVYYDFRVLWTAQ